MAESTVYRKKGLTPLANKIIEVREKKGLTVLELARLLGTSANWLYQIERGERTPGSKLIKRLCKTLNVSYLKNFYRFFNF